MAFSQYPTMQTIGAQGAYQTMGAPMMTTMAAPQMTYGATTMAAPQMTYGATTMAAPMIQSFAAPAVEYIQAAPQVTYAAAPQVTYAAPAIEIDQVNAFGQVVERDFVVQAGPRNLLAMGNVISERVITIEELEANDRYGVAEAVMVAPAVLEIDRVNAFGQVVERDFVGAAPMIQSIAAPAQYVTAAPQMMTYAAPAVEIDQVNAFGQVVERDFVGAAPQVTYAAAPQMTYGGAIATQGAYQTMGAPMMTTMAAPQMTYGAPQMTYGAPIMSSVI